MLDWLRLWADFLRLNLKKARHRRRLASLLTADPARRILPAPCQSGSDSGRALHTRCEACLALDHSARLALVCPDLRLTPAGAFCAADAADVRPYWSRAFAALLLPPVLLALLAIGGAWLGLRHGAGLKSLPLLDVAWPPRWSRIAEHRRAHFRDLTLGALAAGDIPTATIALFSTTAQGAGTPAENTSLARLATLGGYHSLADELHTANLAAHPGRAQEFTLAWHDDLLIAARPLQLAKLSLTRLATPSAPRDFWLRAFFESLRHPGVAASLLALDPPLPLAHPGLLHALRARAALDRRDPAAASDALLALAGLPPGPPARRFLAFSWLDAGQPRRAQAAALDNHHPAPPGEVSLLAYVLLHAEAKPELARQTLAPLLADPARRPAVVAALIARPDAGRIREFAATLTIKERRQPRLLSALWLAARRLALDEVSTPLEAALAVLGHPVPDELKAVEFTYPATRAFDLAAAVLPLDRETLYALRTPR